MTLTKKLILAGVALVPLFFVQAAEAREYCREYNKSIRVGGRVESGYGTACYQPDGSWMIVDSSGTVDPFDDLRRADPNVILVSERPVYYTYGPSLRPVNYYRPAPHFYGRPRYYNSGVSFYFGDWDRHDHKKWRGRDRDRHDWNGRGNGHHKGRGRGHDHD